MPRVAQRKLEFAVGHRAPCERLGSLKSQRGFRLGAIGVLELGLARDLFNVSLKLTRGLNRHGHLERGNVIAVGDAAQFTCDLADLIGVLARLVVGDLAETDGRIALAHGRSRGRRHRGVVPGHRREFKLKLIGIRPVAALKHLGQAKVGLGIHRCRRQLIANLAVIAQVNVNLRGVVVPLGVEHVIRGTGAVAAHTHLGGVEFVNKGKACGSLAKRQVSARVAHEGVLRARGVFAGKLDNSRTGFNLVAFARYLKLILVVIGALGSQRERVLRWRRAVLIRVNGGILLEIVVAVGIGRLKVCNRITQRASVPLVRVEVNGLGIILRGGRIALDVVLEPRYVLGRKQVIERVFLDARGVAHLDGLSLVDLKYAIGNLKVAQRNQRRRNLDRYDIAGLGLALFGMLNGDDQVRSGTLKCVGVDIALGLL